MTNHDAPPVSALPPLPVDRLTAPVRAFMHVESSSGVVLGACTLLALAAANSSLAEPWRNFWNTHLTVGVGGFALDYPLWYWVNDALMAVFFFVIGLEIKRELVHGELSDPRRVALPVAAAFGGAAVPALIYVGLIGSGEALRGWAVPMATDIAFVVGVMALFGRRLPHGLKIMVLTLAIVDDIIAVAVIALFYSGTPAFGALFGAVGGLVGVWLLNRLGVRSIGVYVLAGGVVWLLTLKSGVHPTVAGVALGLMTPAHPLLPVGRAAQRLAEASAWLTGEDGDARRQRLALAAAATAGREGVSPLTRLETALHPWSAFVIMPLFALANAGVPLSAQALAEPVALATGAALLIGKPVGILAASWLAVRMGAAALPVGVGWLGLFGAGCLAGIGFTMALFIAALGHGPETLDAAKAGVLAASLVAALVGAALLAAVFRRPASASSH